MGIRFKEQLVLLCGQSEKAIGEYISSHPKVSVVIPGASRVEQVINNVKAEDVAPLSSEQMKAVDEIYDRYLRDIIHPQW